MAGALARARTFLVRIFSSRIWCLAAVVPAFAEPASQMSQSAMVLFMDATAAGEAGEIKLQEVKAELPVVPFTHALSPGALLALSKELYGNTPPVFMISIGGENFEPGESLSPKAEAALTRVLALLAELTKPKFSACATPGRGAGAEQEG
ncbi:MAG TPA: hypothetical protein VLV49_18180 [Terriglobales bacterium]|nr:hypothetical protein [Terriglobales bacterium]